MVVVVVVFLTHRKDPEFFLIIRDFYDKFNHQTFSIVAFVRIITAVSIQRALVII